MQPLHLNRMYFNGDRVSVLKHATYPYAGITQSDLTGEWLAIAQHPQNPAWVILEGYSTQPEAIAAIKQCHHRIAKVPQSAWGDTQARQFRRFLRYVPTGTRTAIQGVPS